MRLRFDDRLEKYLFFFVIVWFLILSSALVIKGMAVGEIDLDFTIPYLFFMIIPLIITYAIPWEEEKDIKFDRREAKKAIIYLGVLMLWYPLGAALLLGGTFPGHSIGHLIIDYPVVPPVVSFDLAATLYRFAPLFLIFLFVMIRKQSLKTIGITTRNLRRSMILVIIPFAYLLYCIFTSSFSPASIMAITLTFLIVGIVEEFNFRGFPLFRLEPLGKGMAILITGVLFAAMHGLGAFSSILVPGLAWGLIFSKTRNILPLILLHMFCDIVALL